MDCVDGLIVLLLVFFSLSRVLGAGLLLWLYCCVICLMLVLLILLGFGVVGCCFELVGWLFAWLLRFVESFSVVVCPGFGGC